MSEDKSHIIYRSVNTVNDKFYIGVHTTSNLNDDYYGSGKLIKQAIEKYGISNFEKEVLGIFQSRELAFEMEEKIITAELLNDPDCYNVTRGGNGALPGENHFLFGKSFSEDSKKKMSRSHKGVKLPDRSGENHWCFGKKKPEHSKRMSGENNPWFGVTGEDHPLHGYEHSEEAKKRISNAVTGAKHPRAQRYRHKPTGKVFETGKAAAHWAKEEFDLCIGTFWSRITQGCSKNEFEKLD